MNWKGGRWAAAIVLSGVIHAGAAAVVLGNRDEAVQIKGTAGFDIALLGSFEDAVSAGEDVEPTETVDPVRPTSEAVQPEPQELAAVVEPDVERATPVAPASAPTETTDAVTAVQPDYAEPLESDPAEAAQVAIPTMRAPLKPAEPDKTQAVARATPPQDAPEVEEAPAMRSEAPVEAVEPVETARLAPEAVEAIEPTPIIPEDAPVPTVRPEPVREAALKPDRPEPKAEPERKKPQAKAQRGAGNGGKQAADSRKGQATGREDGSARASGAGNRKGGSDGNAVVSNYPGKVAAKLRRAVRSVSRAARRGAKRDVHVNFVVTASGGLGSVRLTQSSGSSELDQAALASVRRAAPFPPIPAGAGRSRWSFSVPLGLAR